jgi:hypothetical protein
MFRFLWDHLEGMNLIDEGIQIRLT